MQDSIHQQNEELKLLRKYVASLETRISILLQGLDNVYKETDCDYAMAEVSKVIKQFKDVEKVDFYDK